tara:strand:- start:46 stop:435 length:390 start_codon:yes stop_codon:yes gene_type:complete
MSSYGSGKSPPTDTSFINRHSSKFRSYQQTAHNSVEATIATNSEAQATAAQTLATMERQREKLLNAHHDMDGINQAMDETKASLKLLQHKHWLRRKKLHLTIGFLVCCNVVALYRLVKCGGSFWCRYRN